MEEQAPTWYPMAVIVKETGEEMLIKSNKFNPELYSLKPVKGGIKLVSEDEAEEASAEENLCAECEKTFKTPAALKAHNTRYHK